MKKIIAAILTACLAFSLAACGNSKNGGDVSYVLNGAYVITDEIVAELVAGGESITAITFNGNTVTLIDTDGGERVTEYVVKGDKLTFDGVSLSFDKNGAEILLNGVSFGKKSRNADASTADNKTADSETPTPMLGDALPSRPDSCVADLANILGDGYSEYADEYLFPWIESIDGIVAESLNGSRLYIVTIPTLNGAVATEYAGRLLESWKSGDVANDYNMLLLIASNEKQAAFALGSNLKSVLTQETIDAWFSEPYSDKRFWDYFNAGEYVDAIGVFVDHLEDDWLYDWLDRGKSDGGTNTVIEDTAYPTIYKSTIAELHKRILTEGMKNAFRGLPLT